MRGGKIFFFLCFISVVRNEKRKNKNNLMMKICRFIFLECPKFVGSAYAWEVENVDETERIVNDSMGNIISKDNNIIPQEIAEKIVDNILLRNDHFKVLQWHNSKVLGKIYKFDL